MSEPIKIFIGTSSNGEDAKAEMVYEYSIRKNATVPVDIVWMRQTRDESSPWGGWETPHWSTPFSGFRWIIPEVCNFEGRAIYTDCDMINFKDMKSLIDVDMDDKPIAARRGNRFGGHEFCVMVFDCAAFEEYSMMSRRMKMIPESHHRMINKFSGSDLVKDLDPKWNCLDGEYLDLEDIWQLHYTNMATQPWRPEWYVGPREEHKRKDIVDIWYSMYEEAKAFGLDEQSYMPEEKFGSYNIIGK